MFIDRDPPDPKPQFGGNGNSNNSNDPTPAEFVGFIIIIALIFAVVTGLRNCDSILRWLQTPNKPTPTQTDTRPSTQP